MLCHACGLRHAIGFFDDFGMWTTDQDLEACAEFGMMLYCQRCADLQMNRATNAAKSLSEE